MSWLPIAGYEGLYDVSDDGRVYSRRRKLERVTTAHRDGYATLILQGKRHYVHRLVCAAFNGPPNALHPQVAHLNGDNTDNRATNLKWVSAAENDSHKDRHGTRQAGDKHPCSKLTAEQVAEIRRSDAPETVLAKLFGVNRTVIGKIRRGETWRSVQPIFVVTAAAIAGVPVSAVLSRRPRG